MVTAKIGGITRPCTTLQKMISDREPARPAIKVGTTSANIAATITRFLPSTSATVPVNGAVSATARVLTVMMVETSAALAPNSADSSGRMACGAYRLMKQQKPVRKTANCRVENFIGNPGGRGTRYRSYASVLALRPEGDREGLRGPCRMAGWGSSLLTATPAVG